MDISNVLGGELLLATDKIEEHFVAPHDKNIHIIVELPDLTGEFVRK